jgi:hypothetical protein
MTVQQFFKGLLMAIISVLVVIFSQAPVNYALLIVTAIATVLAYVGKNLIGLISTSDPWKLNLVNFISALIIALATGITESIGMLVIDGKVAWITLLKIVGGVTLTYLASTLVTGKNTDSKQIV